MKKKIASIAKKVRRSEPEQAPGRITNETVAEHRERILAGGRRFKYPIQYARIRLIRNTVLLTLLAVILFGAFTWWQLYRQQDTSGFFYRITQILPLPVAKVDNENAPYSYYLLTLRSAMYYKQTNENVDFGNTDGKRQLSYLKRTSLNSTIQYAYAVELADQHHISVSDKEVSDFINQIRTQNKVSMDQNAFEASIYKFYGWSYDEFKDSTKAALLIKKVTREIDKAAAAKADDTLAKLKDGQDFTAVAKAVSDDPGVNQTGGDQGPIAKDSTDPNGLNQTATKMQVGQVSGVITGTDGYYILKLIDKNDQTVHYTRIFIAYKAFDQQLAALKKDHKVQEYISVPTKVSPVQTN